MSFFVKHRVIIFVTALSLLASIAYSFWYRIDPVVDAKAYEKIARNIINDQGFRESTNGQIIFDTSIVRAGPGYEYFLAFIFRVFGYHYEAVWVLQSILHALTTLLIFFLAKDIFKNNGKSVGLFSSVIFGLHPDLIEISAMLMTETLYLFLTVLCVYIFVRVFNSPRANILAICLGGITGLAILTRPPVMLWIPVFIIFYLMRKLYVPCIFFILAIVVALTPWTVRNYKVYHQIIPTTLIGSYNLWVGNTMLSNGGQISGGYNPATEFAEKYGYVSFAKAAGDSFKEFVISNPASFIKLSATRTVRFFSLIRPMGFWFYQTGTGQAVFISFSLASGLVMFVLGYAGLALAVKKEKNLSWYLLILMVVATAPLLITVVQSRYRFFTYPFLAIFGGYLYAFIKTTPNWWREKYLWMVPAVLVVVSLFDVVLSFGTILERIVRFI